MINTPEFIKNNLSIVLQGPINKNNLIDIANYCAHWRDILPKAEIILSVSTSDCLLFSNISEDNSKIVDINLKELSADADHNAVNAIKFYCNKILYDKNSIALPLPPVKVGMHDNHINMQIESAYTGIKNATKKFCLCIRNDAVFLNCNFIDIYYKNYNLPKEEKTSILKQRLLISWLYTVNPFSFKQKFPLHISDFLRFGLTEDIRNMLDITFYKYKDSIHFENSLPPNAIFFDKDFNAKIGVEQYVALEYFKKKIPPLEIKHFNDITNRNLSIDIILDNFIISSSPNLQLYLTKKPHKSDLLDNNKRSKFITEEAWRFMLLNRNIPYEKVLTGDVDGNIKKLSNNQFIINKFPSKERMLHPIHIKNKKFILKKIFFVFFYKILNGKKKIKFLYEPKYFFKDSKSIISRIIGKYYLK